MTQAAPVCNGLAVLHQEADTPWLELGKGKGAVALDTEGVTVAGRKHTWPDVESLRLWLVPLPRLTKPKSWDRGYGNWRYGVWLAVLVKGLAFELQHRCGPVPKGVEDSDADRLAALLEDLRRSERRAEFFAAD